MSQHYLSALFSPRSIALFGTQEDTEAPGTCLFRNLVEAGFRGEIYPIGAEADKILGYSTYRSLTQIAKPVDLAVIASPVEAVIEQVEQCGLHGVKILMILTAGFREVGLEGQKREDQVMQLARQYGMRIMGPNCFGFIRPGAGLNLTCTNSKVERGNIALLSQSGSICSAALDWSELNQIGFSNVISTGINADLDFGDYLDFLSNDGATKAILVYIESIHNSRRFMSSLRAAARIKPVVVLKAGRNAGGARASFTHTGSLVGRDEVFAAALDRSGVVRVQTVTQLFAASRILAATKRSRWGERVAILTNGGGCAVMASDRAADLNIELTELAPQTLERLSQALPEPWSESNPIDLASNAHIERYREVLQICLEAEEIDVVILILVPQASAPPMQVAQMVAEVASTAKKPILASWMGGKQMLEARRLLRAAGVPQFRTLENCLEAFSYNAAYQRNQRMLLQVPGKLKKGFPKPDKHAAQQLVQSVLQSGRTVLTEIESFAVLKAFHIPTAQAGVAQSEADAVRLADEIGYPVVLKVISSKFTHKSDFGGVRLNLTDRDEVEKGYRDLLNQVHQRAPQIPVEAVSVEKMYTGESRREVMLGIKRDPVFGPVISFGAGGTYVEAFNDIQVALPPLNRKLARELIQRSRVYKLLGDYRNRPAVNLEALETILLRLSNLACELPYIDEMDINPLMVDEHEVIAVDARIKVSPAHQAHPYEHLAIHPYPVKLVTSSTLKTGEEIIIRPIRPEDAELVQDFVANLSDEAKYFRFMSVVNQISRQMLVKLTQIDYSDEMALVAVKSEDIDTEIGVARYAITPDRTSCEFAIVIIQAYEGTGLAYQLMTHLIEIARDRGLKTIFGEIMANNRRMLRFMSKLGFSIAADPDDPALRVATLQLNP